MKCGGWWWGMASDGGFLLTYAQNFVRERAPGVIYQQFRLTLETVRSNLAGRY